MTDTTPTSDAPGSASHRGAAHPPDASPRLWVYGAIVGTFILLVVTGAVGFSLKSWANQNQVETLHAFADDFAESAELSRRDQSIALEFRTLAERATKKPLTFLEFGVLVVLHRDFLEDGLLAPEELKFQRAVIRDILAEKFDPAMVPRPRG